MVYGNEGDYTVEPSRIEIGTGNENTFIGQINTIPTGVLIVISSDGTTLENLPKIKIETGNSPTT
jgi:hypothetical protein